MSVTKVPLQQEIELAAFLFRTIRGPFISGTNLCKYVLVLIFCEAYSYRLLTVSAFVSDVS